MDGRSRAAREWKKQYQKEYSAYFEALIHCYRTRLTDEERRAYDEWESESLWKASSETYPGTSAWPGWQKYIGPPPWEKVKQ